MLSLFGMFVIGQALEESGYLSFLSYEFFKKAKTEKMLLLFILFGFGFLSALLMNDTIAIIGTPAILILSRRHGISAKPLLLALAFAITIGSATSPIGNPQNLLIAIKGNMQNPFVEFAKYLLLPTIINLFAAYFLIKAFYGKYFDNKKINHMKDPILDEKLAKLSKASLILVILLIAIKVLLIALNIGYSFSLAHIALISMLPIILLSPRRIEIIKKIDWHTLIFFASMFVLMESVWQTQAIQNVISQFSINITSISAILVSSIIISQFISNVPLVALYMPILMHSGVSAKQLVALAAGSTIAGNLLVLGAASNVIIIENAEKRGRETITFFEFAKIGIPLTIINLIIYWLFLLVIP
jgi:Na+/H+ antiporter NhaD/arsenite permease-like protein